MEILSKWKVAYLFTNCYCEVLSVTYGVENEC